MSTCLEDMVDNHYANETLRLRILIVRIWRPKAAVITFGFLRQACVEKFSCVVQLKSDCTVSEVIKSG